MGKRPASMFYWMDFDRDTRALSLRAVGGWMRIMGQLHFSNDRGRKKQSLRSWANVTGCTPSELEKIISELKAHKVGKFRFYNGQLTIISRRMIREEELREKENERVRRFRQRTKQLNNTRFKPILFNCLSLFVAIKVYIYYSISK